MDITAKEALSRTILLIRQQRLPGVDENELLRTLADTTVAVVADEGNIASPSAQSAVTALVGLTAACGMRIRLVIPPSPIAGAQPPLTGDNLADSLRELALDSVPSADAVVDRRTGAGDTVFVVGNTPWHGDADRAWRLAGDAWSGSILPVGSLVNRFTDPFPLGALVAATAASVEPYRVALSRVATATGRQIAEPEFLRPVTRLTVRLAPADTPTHSFGIDRLDVVSGGALSTALLHVLLRIENLDLRIRLWEPEDADASNLNRYMLLRRSMLPIAKVDMLKQWSTSKISIDTSRNAVDNDTVKKLGAFAPWVFVGTDRVAPRWVVQSTWPDHLIVGGTAGFYVDGL